MDLVTLVLLPERNRTTSKASHEAFILETVGATLKAVRYLRQYQLFTTQLVSQHLNREMFRY